MFQYKNIIHRILPTNSLLHKIKKNTSPSCPFCPSECQNLWHLFINCMHASSFWNRFQEWYSISSNTKLLLSELEVMFGIIRCHTYCLALNHLIILGKYFLYVNALNTITYQFDDFVSLVHEKINLAKYIAVTCNKEREFRNKWKFFLSLIVLCPLQGISCPVVWNVLYSRGVNGKEVILRILFCRESFQMIANGEDKFLPLSLFSHLSQHLLCSFTLFALCRRSVVLAQERSGSLSQN